MPTKVTHHALCPLLLAAGLLTGCGGEDPAPRPNIIIYLVDTLRQDHLGLYGYERDTSPSIDALAEDSIVFKQAYATSAWTKASTGSLLTGLNPRQHGATSRNSPLSPQVKLLSEYLGPIGYYCAGIVTNPFVVEHWGFNRGYEEFIDLGKKFERRHRQEPGRKILRNWMQIEAEQVNRRAFKVLDARPQDQPFFLYLHSIDPHGPNKPIKPYDTLFTDNPGPPGVASLLPLYPDKLQNTVDLYDSEVRYSDDQFGHFVQGLKDRGLYEDTVIWFVSDHGEEFLDHGRGGHGTQLFNEVVVVPLLLKLPGQRHGGEVVDTPVSLVDVLVTQLNLLQRHAPETLAGRNLLDLLEPGVPAVPVFLDLNLVAGIEQKLYVSKGVVLGDYKYFEELAPEPRTFLFNLRDDPGETKNLADELPESTAELSLLLRMQRASERSGLVIKGMGSMAIKDAQWSLTMTTDGQFIEVTSVDLESEDSIEYEPGGSTLTIDCDLQPGQNNVVGKGRIQDSDTITIRIDPPDARVFIQSNRLGHSNRMPLFLGPKRKEHLAPVEFAANQEDLRMEQLSTLFTRDERDPLGSDGRDVDNPGESTRKGVEVGVKSVPLGVYIVRLPDANAGEIEIPAEMVERLKALGYM